MTVAELILELQKYDQNARIVMQDPEEIMTLHDIDKFAYLPTRAGKTLVINPEYFSHEIIYERACNHCYHAYDEAGQLKVIAAAKILTVLHENENCQSCGRYLADYEIFKLTVCL